MEEHLLFFDLGLKHFEISFILERIRKIPSVIIFLLASNQYVWYLPIRGGLFPADFESIFKWLVSLGEEIEKWFWTAAIIWDFLWGSWLLLENVRGPVARFVISFGSWLFCPIAWAACDASSNLSSKFSGSLASKTKKGEKTFLHGYFFSWVFTVNIFADNSLNLCLPDKSTTAIFNKKIHTAAVLLSGPC